MQKRQMTFDAIGTKWLITASTDLSDTAWKKIDHTVQERIQVFDKSYSRFRDDSLVTKMSNQAGMYPLPVDALRLLSLYKKLYKVTDGKVTPLIGQVLADAGYDATYSLRPKALKRPPEWEEVIIFDEHTLTLRKPALLDFGAAGKGCLVDIISGLLSDAGIVDHLVSAGGDMTYRTSEDIPLRVGLENPHDPSQIVGVAQITNQSLCASSGSRRKWGKYHHIMDPKNLESPTDIVACWVIANDALTADGLATALYFTKPQTLRQEFLFSYAILKSDMQLEYSTDFPAKLFKEIR